MTLGLAGKAITYTYANEPTQIVFAGQTTTYTYGPGAIRQTKVVDGVTTFYTSIAEIRNFGTANETIILQPHADFRITDAGGANESTSYLHRDHLASVRLITNAVGLPEQSTTYTPFGDPDTQTLLATATPEEHSFIGERYDASTGLLFLNARYYDPDLGRSPPLKAWGCSGLVVKSCCHYCWPYRWKLPLCLGQPCCWGAETHER